MDELDVIQEKKKRATLAERRSFFVRMVSDPAIQPGFTKTPNQIKLDTQTTLIGPQSQVTT